VVRAARPGDGAGCAAVWADIGRHLEELDPELGREPDAAGLAEWFEQGLADDRPASALWLIAIRDGQLAGFVSGAVEPPPATARWQLQRDLAVPRLVVGVLAVRGDQRRSGVGTALMTAIEAAGRGLGAAVALLDTNLRSPLSVPFYEQRMGYARRAVIFRKRLGFQDGGA
jgi:GNAT superfamily N-acetyltransferase